MFKSKNQIDVALDIVVLLNILKKKRKLYNVIKHNTQCFSVHITIKIIFIKGEKQKKKNYK